MKKRILSVLLAVFMIVPMICATPITASAAVTNDYSYKFLDTDIRNIADGQVVDLEYAGEAKTAPVMDGIISAGEYSVETSMKRHSNAKAHASLPMHLAVKDGYLYVAIEYAGETKRTSIQWDITVLSGHQSHQAYSRVNPTSSSSGAISTGKTSMFMGLSSSASWAPNTCGVYQNKVLIEHGWKLGVYEAKFDLMYLYRVYGLSVQCENVWESPLVGLFFFYDVSNESDVGQSQYSYTLPQTTYIDSGRGVGWVPKTIIIPQTALDYICDRADTIGELGFDARNAAATQLATIPAASTVAPVQNGTVAEGEYAVTQVHKQNIISYYGDLTAHYAVKDGIVYAAFQYEETTPKNVILQFGLSASSLPTAVCRTGYNIKTDGTFSNQNYLYKDSLNPNGWLPATFGGAGTAQGYKAMLSSSYSNVDGITTIEISASLPILVASFEDTGWDADMTNAISFMLYPDLVTDYDSNGTPDQLTMSFSTAAAGTREATLLDQIKSSTGLTYGVSCVEPTVQLPAKYIRDYTIDNADDLGAYGQTKLNAKPATAVLDGKISPNEYTTSMSYDAVRSSDSKATPDVSISGTNYFAHDGEYIYVGAEVYDPYYISGRSYYQFNIAVINKDAPFDIGNGVTRLNSSWYVYADGTTSASAINGILRSQACNSAVKENGNAYVGQTAWVESSKQAIGALTLAGTYNAETGYVTYESKIPKAGLMAAFGVDEIDSFTFMNYVVAGKSDGGTASGYNFFKTNSSSDRIIEALRGLTQTANAGATNYYNDFFQFVVDLDYDMYTKNSASVRISTANSGLRFKTVYSNDYIAYMQKVAAARGETLEIGTIIAPEDYITGEFTHAALGTGKYVDVMASVTTPYSNAGGITTVAGSLVNIKDGNLDRNFAGRGFIKIGNEYFYSDTYTVKNVSDIATAAVSDTASAQGNGYNYEISTGVWSPYSEGQREVLNALIVK